MQKTPAQILNEAIEAANAVAVTSSEDWYCGFAWVKITPARGAFVNHLKKAGIGSKGYTGGYDIWSSEVTTSARVSASQSMTLKENVCMAFAASLRDNGVNAYMKSRCD